MCEIQGGALMEVFRPIIKLTSAHSRNIQTLQGVTAASSGTHTHASAGSRRLAWHCLARPSAGHRSYRRGAAEIPAGSP